MGWNLMEGDEEENRDVQRESDGFAPLLSISEREKSRREESNREERGERRGNNTAQI